MIRYIHQSQKTWGNLPTSGSGKKKDQFPAMIIKERNMNGLPVVSLSGKLDIFSKNAFKETAEKYTDSNSQGLILDFQGVTFLDSVGLGALVVLAKKFLKLKGRMIIVNPQDPVKTLLSEMHMEKIIPMYTTDSQFSTFSEL
jgi:anti-sigma B factor antagonist